MRTWILALLILVGGVAPAQSAASVGVGIRIPAVVGLRLAEVEGPMVSALELGPGVHTLRLVANTQWELRVEVEGQALLANLSLQAGTHVLSGRGRLTLTLEVPPGSRVRLKVALAGIS
ncbi:hypothetical protein BVI061214_02272 [Thermus aquaticus]|jgi:hypothetical protein|uniref:PEGA domain protein n=1 Tax=Thermus aquaticus TaxID=271 RepID=A0A0M9AGQ3_THEAQ|nr:hypothetical protein [Thermus aquaticus]KOX91068.1 hypothetical protein BVI061214_02272 [Thermus aquaticus]